MEDKISEKFCKGKEFVDCVFVNRNWDCNRELCPLSKNKTKDVKKHIGRIIEEAKLQGKKERDIEFKQVINDLEFTNIIRMNDKNPNNCMDKIKKELLEKFGLDN